SAASFNDTYTLNMIGTIDGGQSTVTFGSNPNYNFVGGNDPWAGFNTPANDDSQDLLLTPIVNGLPSGTVNTNANTGGINNSFADATEAMRVDFVTDLSGNPAGAGGYDVAGNRDHLFDGHYNANGATATFTGINGGQGPSTVLIKAFDDISKLPGGSDTN